MTKRERHFRHFGVYPPDATGKFDVWAGYDALFVRRPRVHSFTMLTISADKHGLMRNFLKPADEKRMVVILPVDSYDAWLDAKPAESMDFMRQYAGALVAAAVID